jgi:hypothetical protein
MLAIVGRCRCTRGGRARTCAAGRSGWLPEAWWSRP